MQFKPIASSSKGNCYIVESGGRRLVLELGIRWAEVRRALNFDSSKADAALVSHSHSDHSKGVKDALKAGVDVWTSKETAMAIGIESHHRFNELSSGVKASIGPWTVLPFDLHHDVPTHGFYIGAPDGESLAFIPDTSHIRNRFAGFNILAIECNNVEDVLSDNIVSGKVPVSLGHRVRRNHLSLERVVNMLKANDLSKCREIWLLHLSDQNSDEARMIRTVQEQTGIPCRAAQDQ